MSSARAAADRSRAPRLPSWICIPVTVLLEILGPPTDPFLMSTPVSEPFLMFAPVSTTAAYDVPVRARKIATTPMARVGVR